MQDKELNNPGILLVGKNMLYSEKCKAKIVYSLAAKARKAQVGLYEVLFSRQF